MDVKMLILCCFLIILDLKVSEEKGGRAYMVAGYGRIRTTPRYNSYRSGVYRKNGANKLVLQQHLVFILYFHSMCQLKNQLCRAMQLHWNHIIIKLNDDVYYCVDSKIKVSHLYNVGNKKKVINQFMICDLETEKYDLFCMNGTLFSTKSIVCNETNQFVNFEFNKIALTLNCYFGSMIQSMSATVPTEGPEYVVITDHMFLL